MLKTQNVIRRSGAVVMAVTLLLGLPTAVQATPASAADFEALKTRVQIVQDRLDIQQLIVEYGHLLDTHDYVGYSRLFARDGEWIGGFGRAKGPKAIEAMMNKYMATANVDSKNVYGFHLLTNIVIHLDGDHATAWSRLVYMARNKDNKPGPVAGGHYDDTFVRENGVWKFQRRVVMMEIPFQDPREIKGEPPVGPPPAP
jgi:hypothetical protein